MVVVGLWSGLNIIPKTFQGCLYLFTKVDQDYCRVVESGEDENCPDEKGTDDKVCHVVFILSTQSCEHFFSKKRPPGLFYIN